MVRKQPKFGEMGFNAGLSPVTKGQRLRVTPVTEEQVVALIKACPKRSASGARNRAMLALLWATGLRISEVLAVRPMDIDLETQELFVVKGKNRTTRTVKIWPFADEHLALWLAKRRMHLGHSKPCAPLICGIRQSNLGEPILNTYTRSLLRRLNHRLGTLHRVSWNSFRNGHARWLLEQGTPIDAIAHQLGHASPVSTAAYIYRSETW